MFAEVRVRLYSDLAGYRVLHSVTNVQFDTKYKDIGAISFDITKEEAELWSVKDQSVIEICPDGDSTKANLWYVIESTSKPRVADGQAWISVSGRSLVAWLEDGIVYPSSWPDVSTQNTDGSTTTVIQGHSFENATPGTIIRTLVARCQERGTLLWLDVSSFSGTTTSWGNAWATTFTTTYANGTTLLEVLQDLANRDIIEYQFIGTNLWLGNKDEGIGHYAAASVSFFPGRDLVEGSVNTDSSTIGTAVLIQGADGMVREVVDSTAETTLGRRREKFVSQTNIKDVPTLLLLANSELELFNHVLSEESIGLVENVHRPWFNFDVGDWIWEDIDGVMVNVQIRQISAASQDSNTLRIGITLGDVLDAWDEKIQRLIDNITGGSGGVYGALPNTNTYAAPSSPNSLVSTPQAYRDENGVDGVEMTITWTPLLTDTDGNTLTNLDHYELQTSVDGASNWSASMQVPASDTPQALLVGLPPGKSFYSRARAVTRDGDKSDWSLQTNTISSMPKVSDGPPTPSTPVASDDFGGITVEWDGLDDTASTYDSSWSRTDVFVSTGSGFIPSSANRVGSFNTLGGKITVPGLAYDTTYYTKLVAVDTSGNSSSASGFDSAQSKKILAGQVGFDSSDIGGLNTYAQTTTPSSPQAGDIWFDTTASAGNSIKRYNGSSWDLLALKRPALDTGSWTTITLNTGVTNTTGTARFFKDASGVIHVEGFVNVPSGTGLLFTLPTGALTGQTLVFSGYTNAGAHSNEAITVNTDGTVVRGDTTATGDVAVSGIIFLAAG